MNDVVMYFEKGGLVMWPLLLCSLFAIAIGIERFIYYRTADSSTAFANAYCEKLAAGTLQDAAELAAATKGQLAAILTEAAPIVGAAQTDAFTGMKAGVAISRLRQRLNYLSVIVTLSPLLGLLGTIVGMIGAFSIFDVQAGAPMAITGGIGEALIATATGLCVAILSLCIHSFFAQWMDNMITDMEQCFSALSEAKVRGGC